MELLLICLTGYLIGSIPFAYVIGKVFYKTDVRQHGSGNLGGSNTGRVLGARAGIAVMTLDFLKVTLCAYLAAKLSTHPWTLSLCALCAGFGHCFPLYVRFRGGKAVAALYGFLFALWLVAGYSPWVFFLPLLSFLTVLAATKIVSLSSILSSVVAAVLLCLTDAHISARLAVAAFSVLILLRHSSNIRRMRTGTERKIKWL